MQGHKRVPLKAGTQKQQPLHIIPGFQARLRVGRWSWTLKLAQKRSCMSREVKLGCESWTSFASGCSSTAVQRILSLWQLSMAVETAIAQCTSRCAMASGHNLNTSIVLAAVHGLFWAVSAVEPSLSRPLPPLPPQPRFCGRKAIWSRSSRITCERSESAQESGE